MKKIFVLLTVLSAALFSCKKEKAPAVFETAHLALENAAVVAAGNLSFVSKPGTGAATIHRQENGKYVLGLEQMNLTAGSSVVIYLSGSKDLSAPYIKVFSATDLHGNVYHILPAGIDLALFKYIIIQSEPSEAVVASAELR